ncbi:hypothetical protein CFE70_002422 [Pyrenophora teres f. teres 0-1]
MSAMPEGKQVVTVENQDPLFLRLFVKYLYNNELEEQEVVSTMEPSDLGWWIDWYHGYHTDQWNDGSRAMIAWAVLHNKAFLFHEAFLWLIARCPAMGTAILIEQAKQLEESESFACYFRDQKEKKTGWFTVHES